MNAWTRLTRPGCSRASRSTSNRTILYMSAKWEPHEFLDAFREQAIASLEAAHEAVSGSAHPPRWVGHDVRTTQDRGCRLPLQSQDGHQQHTARERGRWRSPPL